MKKFLFQRLFLLITSAPAVAQTVSGGVTDADGNNVLAGKQSSRFENNLYPTLN